MTVSWDEVPCSRQNGPITGYLLFYSSATYSNTINVTGRDNRHYILTTLTPYTNYTLTVTAYNNDGTGPPSSKVLQLTEEIGESVTSDVQYLIYIL